MNYLFYLIGAVILSKVMATKYPEKISKHITFAEAIRSSTAIRYGIKNIPNSKQLENMELTAMHVFEPVRRHFNIPIRVNSFFRSKELNKKLKYSNPKSQHCSGQAIDISSLRTNVSNADLFNYIKDNLEFDQLIWEFGNDSNPAWVHVSFSNNRNRKQVLKAIARNGKKYYINY